MTLTGGRDGAEIEALITDRYLESLLAAHGTGADATPAPAELDRGLRAVADRLARDLPRLHPSFRFEEALAARLPAAAVARSPPGRGRRRGRGRRDAPLADDAERAALAAYVDGVALDGDPDGDPDPAAADRRRADLGRPLARRRGVRRLAARRPAGAPMAAGRPGGRPGDGST